MATTSALALGIMALALGASGDVSDARPRHAGGSKCTAATYKVAGRTANLKTTCVAKAVVAGGTVDPGCLAKAGGKFAAGFSKAESKGDCLTTGDAGPIGSRVDAFVADITHAVTGNAPGPFVASQCNAIKIESAGKKAAAKAKCQSHAAGDGVPVDAGCLMKAETHFSAAIGSAEAGSDCTATRQTTTLESKVDAFIRDLVSALQPPQTTTSTMRPQTTTTTSPATAHYEYVFPDGSFSVYDMDNGHRLVKSTTLSQAQGIRGVVAHAATHSLYVSYGGDGNGQNGTPSMLKYDLLADAVVWTHTYAIGIDSMSISPDGKLIYMPSGELTSGGTWYVINAGSGDVVGSIAGPSGPHNTIVSLAGARVYLGGRADNNLAVADTSTNQVVERIGPLQSSVRPFTVNGRETVAYIAVTGLRGFQVGDLTTGKVLYTVTFTGPNVSPPCGSTCPSAPSHGISLSPDEREVYVIDWPDYVHVFDVSGVPGNAPRQVADIKLSPSMNHNESPCLYDCLADGWLQHSRDGRFVYVGDQGDVIDTATRQAATNLSTLYNTRKMIEIDWANGVPVFAATARASVGYVR